MCPREINIRCLKENTQKIYEKKHKTYYIGRQVGVLCNRLKSPPFLKRFCCKIYKIYLYTIFSTFMYIKKIYIFLKNTIFCKKINKSLCEEEFLFLKFIFSIFCYFNKYFKNFKIHTNTNTQIGGKNELVL